MPRSHATSRKPRSAMKSGAASTMATLPVTGALVIAGVIGHRIGPGAECKGGSGHAMRPCARFFSAIASAAARAAGWAFSSAEACNACADSSSSGKARWKYGSAPSRCASDIDDTSVGLHDTISCVRNWPLPTRNAPSTNACSDADGVDMMSRSTPPTEPDAIITEIERPSNWSLEATTMPSMSSIPMPASANARCAVS